MVHSIIIPLPLDAHISIKQSIYSENIIINYMTIMIKNYAARLDIVKISVFLVLNGKQKFDLKYNTLGLWWSGEEGRDI